MSLREAFHQPKNMEQVALPSPLRIPTDRIETKRTTQETLRREAERRGHFAPESFAGDEHYWSIVARRYYAVSRIIGKRNPIGNPNQREAQKDMTFAIVLDEAREIIEAEKHGVTDGLTGLWNRAALDNHLNNLTTNQRSPIGLLMVDIDRFKVINDTYGHQVGDQVLREVAHKLKEASRSSDMAARYGGEEFTLVMPGVPSLDIVAARGELIRRAVEKLEIKIQAPQGVKIIKVTISLGATTIQPNTPKEAAIKKADTNLYKAKESGRNAVMDDTGRVTDVVYRPDPEGHLLEKLPQGVK